MHLYHQQLGSTGGADPAEEAALAHSQPFRTPPRYACCPPEQSQQPNANMQSCLRTYTLAHSKRHPGRLACCHHSSASSGFCKLLLVHIHTLGNITHTCLLHDSRIKPLPHCAQLLAHIHTRSCLRTYTLAQSINHPGGLSSVAATDIAPNSQLPTMRSCVCTCTCNHVLHT